MKFKPILIILTIVAFSQLGVAMAQTNNTTITPSHLAAAERMVQTFGFTSEKLFAMRLDIIKSMTNTIPMPEKNKARFTADMSDFFNKYMPYNIFKDRFVKLYAEVFTEDELNQLSNFYASPIGKKMMAKLPELMQKGMAMNQEILKDHYSEIETIANDATKQ